MPAYLSNVIVPSDHALPVEGVQGTVLVTVLSEGPVYYGSGSNVTASHNLGNITSGNSQVFANAVWLRGAQASPCSLFYAWGPGPTVAEVPFASTIKPPLGPGDTALNIGTLTGDLTINAPAGFPVDAQTLRFRFMQDSGGNHTITFDSLTYVWGTDVTAALLPSDASSGFEVLFSYHSVDGVWRALAITRGF